MSTISFYLKADIPSDSEVFLYGTCMELGCGDPQKGVKMDKNPEKSGFKITLEISEINIDDWYSYCIVPSESDFNGRNSLKRKFPKISEFLSIYDDFDTEQSTLVINSIIVNIRVAYRTYFGENLYLLGDSEETGNWELSRAVPLKYLDSEHWGTKLEFPVSDEKREIHFKYFVYDKNKATIKWEPCDDHSFVLEATNKPCIIDVIDPFRFEVGEIEVLSKKPFTEVFHKRKISMESEQNECEWNEESVSVSLSTICPLPINGQTMKVVGSSKIFGEWNERKALAMSDDEFPKWKLQIDVPRNELPAQYKYVMCDQIGRVIAEARESHDLTPVNDKMALHIQSDDWMPTLSVKKERRLCISVLLNEERTFSYLYEVVDFCKEIGASMIQVSNVFCESSAFALDSSLIDAERINGFDQVSQSGNKMETLKQLFESNNHENEKIEEFVENNNEWLQSWLAFNSDEDSAFVQWIQYIAHQQLVDISNYAKENNIALRCSIPLMLPIKSCDLEFCPDAFTGLEAVYFGKRQGLTTYAWNVETKKWWEKRIQRCSTFFQSIKILGAEMINNVSEVSNMMLLSTAHFVSDKYYTRQQLIDDDLWDIERYTKPYIRSKHFPAIFGDDAEYVQNEYFNARGHGTNKYLTFKYGSLDDVEERFKERIQKLLSDVILVNANEKFYLVNELGNSWRELPEPQKSQFALIYKNRNDMKFTKNELENSKRQKERTITQNGTNMEIVAGDNLHDKEIMQCINQCKYQSEAPEFGIPSLKTWWKSNRANAEKYWHETLYRNDSCPEEIPSAVVESCIRSRMFGDEMWCVIDLDDIASLSESSSLCDKKLIIKMSLIVSNSHRLVQ